MLGHPFQKECQKLCLNVADIPASQAQATLPDLVASNNWQTLKMVLDERKTPGGSG